MKKVYILLLIDDNLGKGKRYRKSSLLILIDGLVSMSRCEYLIRSDPKFMLGPDLSSNPATAHRNQTNASNVEKFLGYIISKGAFSQSWSGAVLLHYAQCFKSGEEEMTRMVRNELGAVHNTRLDFDEWHFRCIKTYR